MLTLLLLWASGGDGGARLQPGLGVSAAYLELGFVLHLPARQDVCRSQGSQPRSRLEANAGVGVVGDGRGGAADRRRGQDSLRGFWS